MPTLRIPRGSSPELQFNVKNADGTPMDLTGIPVSVYEHDLPIVPTAAVVDPPTGLCRLLFPDTTPMTPQKSHQMRIRVGFAGAAGTFTTPLFEVVVV